MKSIDQINKKLVSLLDQMDRERTGDHIYDTAQDNAILKSINTLIWVMDGYDMKALPESTQKRIHNLVEYWKAPVI